MAALPTYDPAEILTEAHLRLHLAPMQSDLKELKDGLKELRTEMNSRFEAVDHRFEAVDRRFETMDMRFEAIHHRMYQLLLSLVVGVFVIVAAMVSIAIWG